MAARELLQLTKQNMELDSTRRLVPLVAVGVEQEASTVTPRGPTKRVLRVVSVVSVATPF